MKLSGYLFLAMLVISQGLFAQNKSKTTNMVKIPEGIYTPFFKEDKQAQPKKIQIKSFYLDIHAVTNKQYLEFVKENPKWRKSQVPAIFSDKDYLQHWKSDLEIGNPIIENSPVTNVSWFAASAYAKWAGKRLPTMDEWEYAATMDIEKASKDPKVAAALNWYRYPAPPTIPNVKTTFKNQYGLYDMYGLVWEWVRDFNSIFTGGGDSRGSGVMDNQLFCAAGSLNATDNKNYPAFMRFGFRESLKAKYSIKSLGFRCAKDATE